VTLVSGRSHCGCAHWQGAEVESPGIVSEYLSAVFINYRWVESSFTGERPEGHQYERRDK
jgi:hypothetical protein